MEAMIGTAGWSISRNDAGAFAANGTALERYSRVFNAVEVNSSFYKPHRPATWARWAESVPAHFRFAVKIPKMITHLAKLVDVEPLFTSFAQQIENLGTKLGLLLVQLPPKLSFDQQVAERFFATMRAAIDAEIVCEPRHATWFTADADAMLDRLRVARVAADPALGFAASVPGGWRGLTYWRLHGSPEMYRSPYSDEALQNYAAQIQTSLDEGRQAWCMFDNTAASAATGNALSLSARLEANRAMKAI